MAKYSWKCNGVCACIGTAAAAGVEQNGSEENEEAVVENEAGAAVARGCSVARFGVVAAANIGEGWMVDNGCVGGFALKEAGADAKSWKQETETIKQP